MQMALVWKKFLAIKVLMPSPCLARMAKRLFFPATATTKEPEIPIFLLLIGWAESKKADTQKTVIA